MSVYRQGPRTFTEIYFSMRHETILSGNIYIYIYTRTNIKNEIERGGGKGKKVRETRMESLVVCSKRKRGWRLGFAALDGRMARTNFAPLLPRARYPLHLPEYREDIRAPPPERTRTLEPSFIHGKCTEDAYTDDICFLKARCVTETQLFRRSQSRLGIPRGF